MVCKTFGASGFALPLAEGADGDLVFQQRSRLCQATALQRQLALLPCQQPIDTGRADAPQLLSHRRVHLQSNKYQTFFNGSMSEGQ
jgi:hypothetical protein